MEGYTHKKYIHITCDVTVELHNLSRPWVSTSWAVRRTERKIHGEEKRKRKKKEKEKEKEERGRDSKGV